MMTIASHDRDNDPRITATRLLRGSTSPSENWDDDFEFQAGAVPDARANAHDAMNAPTRPGQSFAQEESWDDAYEDDNADSSPIKRTQKVVDEDVEDWDSSDNELETENELKHNVRRGKTQDLGFCGFEEEDKTVTARSTSSRPREPPLALPLPIPPSQFHHHFPAHTVLPPPATSPTLSTFSIPLSSARDRSSIYSQDPLMPASNSSAPHLSVMRSYPHATGSTSPRKGRRLRKKSRPPEADIFELEDREPEPVPPSIPVTVDVPQLDIPSPITPPRAQMTPESPTWPSQPSAPPTPSSSLLTRIGSIKRWARRSMGPEDPALSGWRRAKSSTGPSEGKNSYGLGELLNRGGKSSTGPEVRTSMENDDELDLRAVSPTPPAGSKARRSRGGSASGLKSGWFFRTAGAVGSEKDDVTPTVQTIELTPSKRVTTLGLRRRNKDLDESEDREDGQGKTPTPRKAKGKLVPLLKVGGSGGSHKHVEPKSPTRVSKRPSSRDGTDSRLHNGLRPRSMLFPRNVSASMGRHAGLPVSASMSGGAVLLTNTEDSPESDIVDGERKDQEGGMRGLINGVRKLSLVGVGHTHKRPKSTGGDGVVEVTGRDIVTRPRSQTADYPGSKVEKSTSRIPTARLASHLHDQANGLLPPMELESPAPGLYTRRGSLPWADCDHLSAPESHPAVSFAASAFRPPDVTDNLSQHRRSFSTSTSSLHFESSEKPLGSGSSTKLNHSPSAPASVLIPIPTALPDTVSRTRPLISPTSTERLPALESRQATPLHSHPPSQCLQPSTPQSASLGRFTTSPSHAAGLRRNSLGDLKTPLNTLGEHKPQLPPLGELRIPARISRAQQGLRRDMGMVKEFAGCVEQLKRLQATYMALLGDLRDAYEVSIGSLALTAGQLQFHLPSRPPSQIGNATKGITTHSSSSVQHIPQTKSINSPSQLHPARSFSRASHEITRELVRLEHEYGIWWECAELLVELGGGSGVTAGSASNPNLATRSTSTLNTPAEDLLKLRSTEERQAIPRPITHVSSMSEPGSLFEHATQVSPSSKGPPQASPPHPSQWRASTGRHDLSARQLRLLKDMLNTPDPASLAYAAGPYGYGAGYPHPHHHPHTTAETQPWAAWNPSSLTLPSEESSADAHGQDLIAGAESKREFKEKKRRANRLGMLGIREILRGLKRHAVAEGRLSTGDEPARGLQGSESSMSNSAEDDFYNRRRSPWHQHDEHHAAKQNIEPDFNVAMDLPASRKLPPRSPRRPSLASIFRIGNKNVKSTSSNGKSKDTSACGNGNITTEDECGSRLAAGGTGQFSDWERMSRSDLDISAIGSGTATVRAKKKTTKASASRSSINLNHPYSDPKAATPKKTPATSQTSLWDSSPSSATSPPSRLPLSIAEEDGDKHSQNVKTSGLARSKERTSSWSQAHLPARPTSRNGKATMSGTVRSAPPSDLSSTTSDPKLALTPETIKPLLEYAKEVGMRLSECISEVQILLGSSTKAP